MSPIKQKTLENPKDSEDWWNKLPDEDKNLVIESETRYEKNDFISHKDFMQQFEAWKKK
jgi:hypothetical protein